jgi:hypothetical protein
MIKKDHIELLIELVPHIKIVEHRPGELKLKFSLSILSGTDISGINEIVEVLKGIVDTRINLLARSIEISYDPGRISYDLWESLFKVNAHPEQKEEVIDQLKDILGNA